MFPIHILSARELPSKFLQLHEAFSELQRIQNEIESLEGDNAVEQNKNERAELKDKYLGLLESFYDNKSLSIFSHNGSSEGRIQTQLATIKG